MNAYRYFAWAMAISGVIAAAIAFVLLTMPANVSSVLVLIASVWLLGVSLPRTRTSRRRRDLVLALWLFAVAMLATALVAVMETQWFLATALSIFAVEAVVVAFLAARRRQMTREDYLTGYFTD